MKRIIRNAIKCNHCGDIIVSKHRHDFVTYEPISDGNGRTGRLILFRECLKNGIVPIVIGDVNRNKYFMQDG